jgi:hypothetical protein
MPPISDTPLLVKSSQASSVCPSGNSNTQMKMGMQQEWNNADRGKTGVLEEKRVTVPLSAWD